MSRAVFRSDELHWRKVTVAPGNVYYVLTRPAVALDGTSYGKGTKVRTLSGGYSNVHNANIATVTVIEVAS